MYADGMFRRARRTSVASAKVLHRLSERWETQLIHDVMQELYRRRPQCAVPAAQDSKRASAPGNEPDDYLRSSEALRG